MSVVRYKIFLLFTGNWQLNVLSSHTIVSKYKTGKKACAKIKQLYLFSHCFGNSYLLRSGKIMWQYFWSKLSILSQVWKVAVLDSEKTFLFHTKTSNFWRSNGTYLNIFRLHFDCGLCHFLPSSYGTLHLSI